MNETKYLVDNNALLHLGRTRRATPFFREHCRITDDVLHEARFLPDLAALKTLRYDVTPGVLEHARSVMRTVPLGDTALVDLYQNAGTADPVIIASALDAIDREDGVLIPYNWVIVTRDKAVLAKALEFGIDSKTPPELAALIDAAEA